MMKVRKEELINKIYGQSVPSINIPGISGDTSPNSTFNALRQSIEWAIKNYVDSTAIKIVEQLYTTEEFEDDLGLNKPR